MVVYNNYWRFYCLLILVLIPECLCDSRCYVCSTLAGQFMSRCGDEFTLTSIDSTHCQGTCFKFRGTYENGGRTTVVVRRGCAYPPVYSDSCGSATLDGVSGTKCDCTEELCNTGPALTVTLWTVLPSLSVLLLRRLS